MRGNRPDVFVQEALGGVLQVEAWLQIDPPRNIGSKDGL